MVNRIVLIPVFNEAKTIKSSLEVLCNFFGKYDSELEVYCIDDGSQDGSFEIMQELLFGNLKVFKMPKNVGYGGAVRYGLQLAGANGVQKAVIMDSDLTNPPAEAIKILDALHDFDFVKASRFLIGSDMSAVPMKRRIYSIAGNTILRILFKSEIKDVTNGFRGWKVDQYLKLPPTSNGFYSIVEEFYWSKKFSVKTSEIPSILGTREMNQRITSASYSLRTIWNYFRPGFFFFLSDLFGDKFVLRFEKKLLKNE
jgi:glycosyltransferase involved in cell wall biosynthesis